MLKWTKTGIFVSFLVSLFYHLFHSFSTQSRVTRVFLYYCPPPPTLPAHTDALTTIGVIKSEKEYKNYTGGKPITAPNPTPNPNFRIQVSSLSFKFIDLPQTHYNLTRIQYLLVARKPKRNHRTFN